MAAEAPGAEEAGGITLCLATAFPYFTLLGLGGDPVDALAVASYLRSL